MGDFSYRRPCIAKNQNFPYYKKKCQLLCYTLYKFQDCMSLYSLYYLIFTVYRDGLGVGVVELTGGGSLEFSIIGTAPPSRLNIRNIGEFSIKICKTFRYQLLQDSCVIREHSIYQYMYVQGYKDTRIKGYKDTKI